MNRTIYYILSGLLFISDILAQQNHTNESLAPTVNILFPQNMDSVSVDLIRIAGNTQPGTKLRINQKTTRVYPSGAFVDRVRLVPGLNKIYFSAQNGNTISLDTLLVFRTNPLIESPEKPTAIDTQLVKPVYDLWLMTGDHLEVRFKGSPGGRAQFHIDGLTEQLPMVELQPSEAGGMKGIYAGVVKIQISESKDLVPIKYELRGVDGHKVQALSQGRVGVLSSQVPLVAVTIEDAFLWNAPEAGAILASIPPGVRLHITGKLGGRYRIRLSEGNTGYASEQSLKLCPAGTPLPIGTISMPGLSSTRDWARLTMDVSTAYPYIVQQKLNPAEIILTIYGAHLNGQWTAYPLNEELINLITWSEPEENVFQLSVSLNTKQQWGYRVRYENKQLHLEIRKPPFIRPENPFKDVIIALDPGHGGEELGAVGPTGLQEKNVNLTYSKFLASMLDSVGARVVLIRDQDSTMTLPQRIEIARKANAQIFLWLHNNSVGISSDAAAVSGTSTYFTIPQNQALAWKVYPRLLELGLNPFGRIYATYFITRQTDMLILLVEGAFVSNPEDEMRLMQDEFLYKLARAVFSGLKDFLEANSRKNSIGSR